MNENVIHYEFHNIKWKKFEFDLSKKCIVKTG